MLIWKEQTHSKCPRCLTDNETVEHVVRCRHEDATLSWDKGIEEIETWMLNHNSIPGLVEAFRICMNQWRYNQTFTTMENFDESIKSIIQGQDELGWDALMFGAMHHSWSREQGNYLHQMEKNID